MSLPGRARGDEGGRSSACRFRHQITQLAFSESVLCLGEMWAAPGH